jgi:hypothetical protein
MARNSLKRMEKRRSGGFGGSTRAENLKTWKAGILTARHAANVRIREELPFSVF